MSPYGALVMDAMRPFKPAVGGVRGDLPDSSPVVSWTAAATGVAPILDSIIQKLSYVASLGVDAICGVPVLTYSPMKGLWL